MGTRSYDTTNNKPSALEKFNLSFEYDITWQDARKAVRRRADTTK